MDIDFESREAVFASTPSNVVLAAGKTPDELRLKPNLKEEDWPKLLPVPSDVCLSNVEDLRRSRLKSPMTANDGWRDRPELSTRVSCRASSGFPPTWNEETDLPDPIASRLCTWGPSDSLLAIEAICFAIDRERGLVSGLLCDLLPLSSSSVSSPSGDTRACSCSQRATATKSCKRGKQGEGKKVV